MRVLQLSRWLSREGGGGIQTYLSSVAVSLQDSRVSLSFAALMPGTAPEFVSGPVWIGGSGSKPGNAFQLWRWISGNSRRFDLIHVHGVTDWHFIMAVLFSRLYSLPCVVTVHGGLLPGALGRIDTTGDLVAKFYLKKILPRLLMRVDLVVASSKSEAHSVTEIVKSMPIKIIFPSVFVPDRAPSLGPATSQFRLLYLGRIAPIKSLETLLQAVAMLGARAVNVSLDIVGDGDVKYIQSLKRLADDMEISGLITWHGYLSGEEKEAVLCEARLLVLPSVSENFGFVVAEVMSSGRPVVISDGVALCETVRASGAGSVFTVGDAAALSEAIYSYADDRYWKYKAGSAYRCAKREFSRQTMGEKLEAAYREATTHFRARR